MQWYLKVLRQYADFEGRAGRKEFWVFMLFHALASMVCGILDMVLGTSDVFGGAGLMVTAYNLPLLIPFFAVSVRRLHDSGRSAWWWIVWFIPGIGWIAFLVLMLLGSESGRNKYGPSPGGIPTS